MKKSGILSMLLIFALIVSMFSMVLPIHAAPSGIHTRSRTNYTCYSDEQLMELLKVDRDTLNKMRLDAAHAAMTNTDWNVSAYKVARNSTAASALFELLYANPELFFVAGVSYSYSPSTGNITRVSVRYTDSYEVAMEKHQAFISAAQEIICLFQRNESLTDLELALLIHDYLAANYEYDTAFATGSDMYTGYGLLVNGMAVCQAYAETFAYLMMQFGVNTGLCESDALNHAWNIIELDGKEYHLDVTFDDPIYDRDGRVYHTNFLLSTTALKANDHDATDFTGTPENTEYDTAFWQDVSSAFCLLDDTIYYINSSRKLCSWTDGVSTELLTVPGTWKAVGGGYWSGPFNCLSTDGDRLFYSSNADIYEYFPETNTAEVVYSPALPTNFNIYGFVAKNNCFYINTADSPNFTATTKAENTILYTYRDASADCHVYDDGVPSVAPTCTEGGTFLYTCIYCGKNRSADVPATGHTPAILEAVAPTCTEDGLTEGRYCLLCGEILEAAQTIPPQGHDYRYTDLQDGTHTEYCSRCTLKVNKPHSFENGICCCGAIEIAEDTSLKINHTLNLASDISVNFAVNKTLLANYDMNTVYMECSVDTYEGNTKTGTTVIKLLPVDQGYYYYFTLEGLTAVQMNDTIISVLYGSKDGKQYRSATDIYSVADYAYSQLNKDTVAESLKILCADLLRYGSAAQSFKNYRTDAPVDGAMTDAHSAHLSSLEAITFGNTNVVLDDLSEPTITWVGKALELNSKVSLKFVINASAYTGDISALRLKVSYTDYAGQKQTLYLEGAEPYANPGCYAFTFDSLLAAELRSVVAVQVCEGTTPLSCTLQYSADTYGNGKTGTLLTLCKALFAYSDSAKAYFAS